MTTRKKINFSKVSKEHWVAVLEDINGKFDVLGDGQKILQQKFDRFEKELHSLKQDMQSNFDAIHRYLSQVDLFELQERVERIEKHLELRK